MFYFSLIGSTSKIAGRRFILHSNVSVYQTLIAHDCDFRNLGGLPPYFPLGLVSHTSMNALAPGGVIETTSKAKFGCLGASVRQLYELAGSVADSPSGI